MSDPVAEKSGFLRMYMSNHPDTLVAYAKWFGKVKEIITSAEMTAIDSKSMTLTCTLKNGSKKEVRVPIEPPLSGYDDVKPRLLEMKALAQEGLGMIKAPQIKSFHLPQKALHTAILMASLAYLTLSPPSGQSFFIPANFIQSYLGMFILNFIFYGLVFVHALESLYTFSLCWRHSTGFLVGLAYVVSTFFFGFPIWQSLRSRIQAARIDSVMKIQ